MEYLAHFLLVVGILALAGSGLAVEAEHPVGVLCLCLPPHLLAGWGRRARRLGRFRLAEGIRRVLGWTAPALYLLALSALGWLGTVERWFGTAPVLHAWPGLALMLAMAPFVAYSLLAIDARARLGGTRPAEVAHLRGFNARMFLATLLPFAIFVLAAALLGLSPLLRAHLEEVGLWSALFVGALLALMLLLLPGALRRIWSTAPLPAGPLRDRLEEVAAAAGFRCRDLLEWRTGNLMANAAIVGLVPRRRYVLFSDRLLAELTVPQLAAVLAHEIGHARRHHMTILFTWTLSFFIAADLLGMHLAVEDQPIGLGILAAMLAVWFPLFVFLSRRFELEADLESAALTQEPEALAGALVSVGRLHGPEKTSWRHFSVAERIRFLRGAADDPRVAAALSRRLRRWALTGGAAFALVGGLELYALGGAWGEDHLAVDLRLGRYLVAAERLEDDPAPDAGLARLVTLGAELARQSPGRASPAALEEAAREALRAGGMDTGDGYLELAILRGRAELASVREALRLVKRREPAAARTRLALAAPSWQGEVAYWEGFLAPDRR